MVSHQMSVTIYTDGSAVNNVASPDTPAGWGLVVIEGDVGNNHDGGQVLLEDFGAVVTDQTKPEYIGADVGSNNTAELSGIYFAMLKVKGLSNISDVTIYTDSQYAMNIVFGNWSANKNLGLVKKCRQLKDELDMAGITITAKHIRAHRGFRWNERADKLAYAAAYRIAAPPL